MPFINEDDAKMSPLMNFRKKKRIIYRDPEGHFDIHAGDIFEAKTTKGHSNLIVVMRNFVEPKDNSIWMLYLHGGNAKKVLMIDFALAVKHGELDLRDPFKIDTERLAMSDIMFEAFANSRAMEEQINLNEEQMSDYLMGKSVGEVGGGIQN
jgi:hypothetical protein